MATSTAVAPPHSIVKPTWNIASDGYAVDPDLALPCTDYQAWAFSFDIRRIHGNSTLFCIPIREGVPPGVYRNMIGHIKIDHSPMDILEIADGNFFSHVWFTGNQTMDAWNSYLVTSHAIQNPADTDIQVGDSFRFHLFERIAIDEFHATVYDIVHTNLFERIEGDAYLSNIVYTGRDSQFGFTYLNTVGDTVSKMQFNCMLRDPKTVSDSKTYTRSDGEIIKIYERKEEEYMLETDSVPYWWLKALDVALSHDRVQISNLLLRSYNPTYQPTDFVKVDEMKYEYAKEISLHRLVRGSCKLRDQKSIHLINNSCL
jgi:hypothetical protein